MPRRSGGCWQPNGAAESAALLDDDAWWLAPGVPEQAGDLVPDARGDGLVGLGVRAVGLRDRDRAAAVGGLADGHVERDLAEKFGAEPLGLATSTAMGEDVAALPAMRA